MDRAYTEVQICAKVKLDQQVGSRYFVSASNAGNILLLREAALDFLSYSGKCNGNKLEQDIYQKLVTELKEGNKERSKKKCQESGERSKKKGQESGERSKKKG